MNELLRVLPATLAVGIQSSSTQYLHATDTRFLSPAPHPIPDSPGVFAQNRIHIIETRK
jgi:hypothetical protein